MRGVFVTGTDTGVGKSVLSASIVAALRARGENVAASKPVLTGIDEAPGEWPPDDALLAAASGQDAGDVAPLRFGPPVSPHLAAEQAGVELDVAAMLPHSEAQVLVVEGVGGLLVPLGPRTSVRDFAAALGLPVVIAARPGLGTINHTLLTVEAARAGGLDVRAVVMTPWPDEPDDMTWSNAATIGDRAGVDVARLPRVAAPAPEALAEAGAQLPLDGWLGEPSAPVRALDHAVIAISDWDRSNAFYRDVAGVEVVRAPGEPRRFRYRLANTTFNVHGPGMDPEPVARIPVAPGMADLCLVWPGPIDEAAEHLAHHGVPVELGPVPRNGARGPALSVYFRDPDGSLLEFMSYAVSPRPPADSGMA